MKKRKQNTKQTQNETMTHTHTHTESEKQQAKNLNLNKSIEKNSYIFRVSIQDIPHRSNNFGHLAKGGIRILSFDGSLCITEEEGVCRDGFLWLIWVFFLLFLLHLLLFCGIDSLDLVIQWRTI